MDRYWLLSNTCYGNRLPGDGRGFIGQVWDHRPDDRGEKPRVRHNLPGTPCDEDLPGLEAASRRVMKGPPIHLTQDQAEAFLHQMRQTADFRGWELNAVAIMFDHFHVVVGVDGDPKPSKVLGDFKSWGTRALSRRFGEPLSKTWWTERGSTRKLGNSRAVADGNHYVLFGQPDPLITWSPGTGLHYGIPPGAGKSTSG